MTRTALDTDLLPPRYRSPRRIGQGGMGEIFLAVDELLGREVAIKVLSERYAGDEAIRNRFKREALAAARLSGEPSAVTIFDVGERNGRPFIVMEYLGGGSLDDRVREDGAQDPALALRWLEQAAKALDAGHRLGVVHRDVKPANLLLDGQGNVHVADFGIASAAGLDSLTITGTVLGTAGYLAPEQAQGRRAGPESDRYALGVVAYELLSGRRPYENDSPTAEASAHVNAPVPSIAERCNHLPPEVDGVFRRALAKDPAARYASATEFVDALRAALSPQRTPVAAEVTPVAARRRGPGFPAWVLLLALLTGAAIAGALVASALTGGKHHTTVKVRTVVASGHTTTIHQTVTQTQAAAPAPAPPPPPPPPPPPAVSSTDGHTLNDQGYALMQQGDYADALPLLQQAVTKLAGTGPTDPTEGYANYNLGYTLYQLGQCAQAVTYLQRAQQLEPDRKEPGHVLKKAQKCS